MNFEAKKRSAYLLIPVIVDEGWVDLVEFPKQGEDREITLEHFESALARVINAKRHGSDAVKLVKVILETETSYDPNGGGRLFLENPLEEPIPIDDTLLLNQLNQASNKRLKKTKIKEEPTKEISPGSNRVGESGTNEDGNHHEDLGYRQHSDENGGYKSDDSIVI